MNKFYNTLNNRFTADAVEQQFANRWFIKMGFCGFNSPANNRFGYESKAKAEAAILRYQNKSDYIRSLTK